MSNSTEKSRNYEVGYCKTPEHTKWKKGKSGNEKGRTPLPLDIKALKEEALQKAVERLHKRMMDDNYMEDLKAKDFTLLVETAFDRFGLPKVTKSSLDVSLEESEDKKIIVEFVRPKDENSTT